MSSHEAKIRSEGLAFFGRVTAGQSHEVTNVLNIINELAGLQVDLLGGAAGGREPPDLARLAELADRIQAQVARGETIIRNVNRFAHSVDLPTAVFELADVLERVVFMAQRIAGLGRVALGLRVPEESIAVDSNPFCIQQAVFCCIEAAIAAAGENRRVTVSYRLVNDAIVLEVTSADPVAAAALPAERLELLETLLVELSGAVAQVPDEADPYRFLLTLPRRTIQGERDEERGGCDAT